MRARIRNSTGIAVAFTALMTSLRALAQDGYTPEFNFPHTLTLKWEIVVLKKGITQYKLDFKFNECHCVS
jgi:hypothetical protein